MSRFRVLLVATACVLGAHDLRAAPDPAAVFQKKCTSCHTYGKGDLVGPDLKGVTSRRTRAWLQNWIRSSAQTIRSGDSTAVALFAKYRQQRMPDQPLSPEDIDRLLAYLAAGGPDRDRRTTIRSAALATAADVERGRELFAGRVPLASRAAACASCHTVQDTTAAAGASFGGDLSHAYSRFQDAALAAFLQRPCYPRLPTAGVQLNSDESFAVRAYLRQVELGLLSTNASKGGRR